MSDLLTDDQATLPLQQPPADPAASNGAPQQQPVEKPADLGIDQGKQWLDKLPDDLKKHPSLQRFSNEETLARSYLNAEKMIGAEKVPIPKDPNDQEAWDRYYKAGGRPDEPTQYQFQKPEKLPEGVSWDDNMEGWWKQAAFEAGLSQRQAQRLVDQYRDRYVGQIELSGKSVTEQVTKAKMELQRDWSAEYETKRQLAKAAFAEMPEDARKLAIDSGLARMPSFVKYLYGIKASTTGELAPKTPGQNVAVSPDAIRAKISDHREKYTAALMDKMHPEHDLRVKEMTQLFDQLYKEDAAA